MTRWNRDDDERDRERYRGAENDYDRDSRARYAARDRYDWDRGPANYGGYNAAGYDRDGYTDYGRGYDYDRGFAGYGRGFEFDRGGYRYDTPRDERWDRERDEREWRDREERWGRDAGPDGYPREPLRERMHEVGDRIRRGWRRMAENVREMAERDIEFPRHRDGDDRPRYGDDPYARRFAGRGYDPYEERDFSHYDPERGRHRRGRGNW